jgi:hypothetical protein
MGGLLGIPPAFAISSKIASSLKKNNHLAIDTSGALIYYCPVGPITPTGGQ